jgi:hypothetical protein
MKHTHIFHGESSTWLSFIEIGDKIEMGFKFSAQQNLRNNLLAVLGAAKRCEQGSCNENMV